MKYENYLNLSHQSSIYIEEEKEPSAILIEKNENVE